jgi:hypothetical protein
MMFAILRHYGIPEKIVKAIRVLYDHSTSRVYVDGQTSKSFDITTGVLQGDVLAPFLFIIVIDYVTKLSAGEFGYLTHKGTHPSGRCTRAATREADRRVNDLDFANDIALLEGDIHKSQMQLDALRHYASTVGLEINVEKTKQVRQDVPESTPPLPPLFINGQPIEIVTDFKYLGSYVVNTDKDVRNRVGLAWAAFDRLRPILASRPDKPPVNLKMRLFSCFTAVRPGC